jgi:hypothetical protein
MMSLQFIFPFDAIIGFTKEGDSDCPMMNPSIEYFVLFVKKNHILKGVILHLPEF